MAELPSGTVTFLFTDIEGSTRLLKQLGERYGAVLADHRRILREAAEAREGREIDTQGDSFFFAFARANAALGAAVVAQRAFAEHDWPEGGEVRVRMGLHTGEPRRRGGALRRARRASRGADRSGRPRRSGPAVERDPRARRGRGRRRLDPRARLVSTQGHRPPGTALPARHRGTADRVPAAEGREGRRAAAGSATHRLRRRARRRHRRRRRDPDLRAERRLGWLRGAGERRCERGRFDRAPRRARSSTRCRSARRPPTSRSARARSGSRTPTATRCRGSTR